MDLRDCQMLAAAVATRFNDDGDAFRGLARLLEECGEVAAEVARVEGTGSKGFYRESGSLERVEDELADVLINLAGLANTYGLSLAAAMERKRTNFVNEHGDKGVVTHRPPPSGDGRAPRVTVYCSSSKYLDGDHYTAATQLGTAIGSRGWTLVYGGGSRGSMGYVSRATREAGGEVLAVILDTLIERGGDNSHVDELKSVSTMRSRKRGLDEVSNAFVALPGGFGTFEEIIEVISFKQLGFHHRPIVLLNTGGYYDPLIEQFERCYSEGFASRKVQLYALADTVDDAVNIIERGLASTDS